MVDDAIGDPARLAVAARIRVVHDPALDPTYPAHYATRIVVHTVGGAHERLRLIAPGDPEDPMSDEDLAAKFDSLTQSTALAGLGGDLLRDLDSALPGAVYAGRHASGPEPTFSRA